MDTANVTYKGMDLRISASSQCSYFVVGVGGNVYAIYKRYKHEGERYNISYLGSGEYGKEQKTVEKLLSNTKSFLVLNTAIQILKNNKRMEAY